MADSSTFTENQRFEPWLPLLVLVTGVPVPVVLGAVMGVDGVLIGVVLAFFPLALFVPARLTTEVTDTGLSIRFFPFHLRPRHIPHPEIEAVERVQLSPTSYGVNWTRAGWRYTAAGTDGIRIRRGNRDVFLGTQRPEQLIGERQRFDRDNRREQYE